MKNFLFIMFLTFWNALFAQQLDYYSSEKAQGKHFCYNVTQSKYTIKLVNEKNKLGGMVKFYDKDSGESVILMLWHLL